MAGPLPRRRLDALHRTVPGWNTLRLAGAIPDEDLLEAVDASYAAVVAELPRKDRLGL